MPNDPAMPFLTRMHRLCQEQADELLAVLDQCLSWQASPAAPTSRDHARVLTSVRADDRQALWSQVQMNCLMLAVNVADHVRALAVLLAQPHVGVPIYAHATTARVALESAAMLAHILDVTDRGFEVRFARGIAHLITDADEARKAAANVPANAVMPSPAVRIAAEQDALFARLQQARIEVVAGKRGPKGVRVTLGGDEEPVATQASVLVKAAFADLPAAYKLLSGVAHGMPWMLSDNVHVTGRPVGWEPDPIDVGASVLVAVAAAARAAEVQAWHRGFGNDPAVTAMSRRFAEADKALQAFGSKLMPEARRISLAPFLKS
jgi:hypothetical protein